jgi:hypothetical protein
MGITDPQQLRPGDLAPDFSLPAVHREGTVSLGDYRGRSPLRLGKFPTDEELVSMARRHAPAHH